MSGNFSNYYVGLIICSYTVVIWYLSLYLSSKHIYFGASNLSRTTNCEGNYLMSSIDRWDGCLATKATHSQLWEKQTGYCCQRKPYFVFDFRLLKTYCKYICTMISTCLTNIS